jgi:phospholipid/cholesterol/gamma-HCH transport system ATP-binding protein
MQSSNNIVIEMRKICTRFGSHVVHTDLDLEVRRGEILAIAGGSGSGKSVLLREMILLQRPTSGSIKLFGEDTSALSDDQAHRLRQRWGVLFQHSGLFSSLTVRENVGLPLQEHTTLDNQTVDDIAEWKLSLTGLTPDTGLKMPSQLSGGMLKRAALARAIALDPELLFLDEPTTGLDPTSSAGVDKLILQTHALYGLTIVMVSHDLDLLWAVSDRVAMLGEGKVLAVGTMDELSGHPHPIIQSYFVDQRAAIRQSKVQPPPPVMEAQWKTK